MKNDNEESKTDENEVTDKHQSHANLSIPGGDFNDDDFFKQQNRQTVKTLSNIDESLFLDKVKQFSQELDQDTGNFDNEDKDEDEQFDITQFESGKVNESDAKG